MFKWLFGETQPLGTPGLFKVKNQETGIDFWMTDSKWDCMFCGYPGGECENTADCFYYPHK